MSASMRGRTSSRNAFTLVELLVVIGIIALLISILLPALNSARRQANAIKCATAMREMGQAMNMYSIDNRGYLPPAQIYVTSSLPYNVNGFNYTSNLFLPDFIAKYVTKGKYGVASGSDSNAAVDVRKTVLWGCPAWDGYMSNTTGGVNRIQSGIAMNALPAYEANAPAPGVNLAWGAPQYAGSVIYPGFPPTSWNRYKGVWNKFNAWTHPSQRCLLADSLFWIADSYSAPTDNSFPGETLLANVQAYPTSHSTTIDWYRHGKYPPAAGDGKNFAANGGKVSYNILYADLHVATATDKAEAYRSIRMRYPG